MYSPGNTVLPLKSSPSWLSQFDFAKKQGMNWVEACKSQTRRKTTEIFSSSFGLSQWIGKGSFSQDKPWAPWSLVFLWAAEVQHEGDRSERTTLPRHTFPLSIGLHPLGLNQCILSTYYTRACCPNVTTRRLGAGWKTAPASSSPPSPPPLLFSPTIAFYIGS